MKLASVFLLASPFLATAKKAKNGKQGKSHKGPSFDPPAFGPLDALAVATDADYFGDYETFDASELEARFGGPGALFVFDLGSSGNLFRRRGAAITVAEQRTIFHELAPLTGDNGHVMKSVGDSLQLYFDTVSAGLAGTRAMYLALVERWRAKVSEACSADDIPAWCGDIEEERKRFYNTAAVGGAYGSMILVGDPGRYVDAFGAAVNNAYFAGEEEAEHGETIVDEDALQRLLDEAGGGPQEACDNGTVEWAAGDLGVDHIIVREYPFGCYYTVCFDAECKIPDDE